MNDADPTADLEIVVQHVGSSTLAGTRQAFPGPRVRLGRRPDNEVVFDPERDRAVSGYHAELYLDAGELYLRDLGSQNGTWVSGDPISGPVRIGPEDEMRFGEHGPRLRAHAEAAGEAGAGSKGGIGENTLQRAIAGVQSRQRSGGRRLALALGLAVVAAGVAIASIWSHLAGRTAHIEREQEEVRGELARARKELAANLRRRLQRFDRELDGLKGKLGSDEREFARLVNEITQRDRAAVELAESRVGDSDARRAALDATRSELAELKRKLAAAERRMRTDGGTDWSDLVGRYQTGIFLCVGQDPKNDQGGIGTAFCIRADGLLATNAHVVQMLQSLPQRMVVQSHTGETFAIRRMAAHPDFSVPRSPDVGLIQLEGVEAELPVLPLADEDRLRGLRIGTQLGTLGFPGELTEYYLQSLKGVQATFKDGWIGRMTDFNCETADFAAARLIQHSASTTGGTSGSPMFAADGTVVAVNSGGLSVNLLVADPIGGAAPVAAPSPAEIGFAIRADVIGAFVERQGW